MNDDEKYEVFVRLLMEHGSKVRSFLRGLLPMWHDGEEVDQEASLVAWQKFVDFEEGTSFGGRLLTIARFETLKYRRQVAQSLNPRYAGSFAPLPCCPALLICRTCPSHLRGFYLIPEPSPV